MRLFSQEFALRVALAPWLPIQTPDLGGHLVAYAPRRLGPSLHLATAYAIGRFVAIRITKFLLACAGSLQIFDDAYGVPTNEVRVSLSYINVIFILNITITLTF